jgi:exosortase K
MNRKLPWNRIAQCLAALAGAFSLKLYYSTASADQLRWILAPTTAMVEAVSGVPFEFESRAGYISREHSFLIASSCAGVNFLITAFLMLSMRRLLSDRTQRVAWGVIPAAAFIAYLSTLVANATRISLALWLRRAFMEIGGGIGGGADWMSPAQIHRFEGVFVYFGFLLLLFVVSEKMWSEKTASLFRQSFFPLLVYYATALGLPLANGAYRRGSEFWAHALFVLLIPLLLVLPLAAFRGLPYKPGASGNR